jgi:hypothetical protein
VGFFVGQLHNKKTFFAWAVWLEADLDEGIKHLLWYAKEVGCQNVMFQSDRRGWQRVMKKYNARPNTWIMEI